MMKEVEKMSKLGNEDRNLLQHIQEGLAGVKPIDDKWMTTIIDAIKNKPEIFKTMFKGKGQMFGKFFYPFLALLSMFSCFQLKKI
jgi:NADPH-dependent curcumin reductase CurA